MATKFHPILDQVDGVTDTFTLPENYIAGRSVLAYNGQVYNVGQNIVAENSLDDPPTIQLSFIPSVDTHTLMIIYEQLVEESTDLGIRGYVHPPGGLLNDF